MRRVDQRTDDRVVVECRDGVPTRFRRPARTVGAGEVRLVGPRWYQVRAVIATWSRSTPWWRGGTGRPADRRIWRVEARPVRGADPATGVFDLVALPDGRWRLGRIHD
jgi:hypothetical protein